jgi:hypothetical protein
MQVADARCQSNASRIQVLYSSLLFLSLTTLELQAPTLLNISATVNIAFHLRNLASLPPNLTLGLVSLVSPPLRLSDLALLEPLSLT